MAAGGGFGSSQLPAAVPGTSPRTSGGTWGWAQKPGRCQHPAGAGAGPCAGGRGVILGNREIYCLNGTRLPLETQLASYALLSGFVLGTWRSPLLSPLPTSGCPPRFRVWRPSSLCSVTLVPEPRGRYFWKSSSFDLRQQRPRSCGASLLLPPAPAHRDLPCGSKGSLHSFRSWMGWLCRCGQRTSGETSASLKFILPPA